MKKLGLALCALLLTATAARAVVGGRQVTVTSTATLLCSTGAFQSTACLVVNQGAGSVYLGGNAIVTTSTGLELKSGAGATINLKQSESLYGITASTSYRVDVLESK